jgi:hypothetical protein
MAALLSVASRIILHENSVRLRSPSTAQIRSNAAPPNRHRKNATFSAVCCDETTSQPIVPDISIASVISSAPCRTSLVEAI